MQEPPIREDGLQIDENRSFQRVFWMVERCAWVAFCLVLVLALAGLTGAGGYLSRSSASVAGGSVTYPTISRHGYLDEMRVRLDGPETVRRLSIGPSFFRHFRIETIQPQPHRMYSGTAGTTLEFSAPAAGPAEIVLSIRSTQPGFPSFSLSVDGRGVELSTAILP